MGDGVLAGSSRGRGYRQCLLQLWQCLFISQRARELTTPYSKSQFRTLKCCQIAFQEWTADRKLRRPIFLGLREDKSASECLLPESAL